MSCTAGCATACMVSCHDTMHTMHAVGTGCLDEGHLKQCDVTTWQRTACTKHPRHARFWSPMHKGLQTIRHAHEDPNHCGSAHFTHTRGTVATRRVQHCTIATPGDTRPPGSALLHTQNMPPTSTLTAGAIVDFRLPSGGSSRSPQHVSCRPHSDTGNVHWLLNTNLTGKQTRPGNKAYASKAVKRQRDDAGAITNTS